MGLRTALGLRRPRAERKAEVLGLRRAEQSGDLYGFCASLRDRDCLVLGSAPDPDLSNYKGQPIICCNGSAASLRQAIGRSPDYSFLHCHVLARWNPADKEVRGALQHVGQLGRVVIFDEPELNYSSSPIASQSSEVLSFGWSRRHEIVSELLGATLPFLNCSTGAMTVASVLRAGARSVELIGFSLAQKGHSYNNKDRHRNHVRSDAALFALLGQAGFNVSSREPSISAILTEKID
jgi:hypothetical protein